MPLALKLEIVTSHFDGMLKSLQELDPRVEFQTVLKQEVLKVLQGAADRTSAAKVESIVADEAEHAAGQEWMGMNGKKYLIMGTGTDGHRNRYPDPLWADLMAYRAKTTAARLQKRVAARGLSKQSWLHLAQALGGTISLPGYAVTANYRGQQYPSDVSVEEDSASTRYGITISNGSPIVRFAGGNGALLGAIQGRIGFFNQNMSHQFYLTAERMAAKYPGIFVLEGVAA